MDAEDLSVQFDAQREYCATSDDREARIALIFDTSGRVLLHLPDPLWGLKNAVLVKVNCCFLRKKPNQAFDFSKVEKIDLNRDKELACLSMSVSEMLYLKEVAIRCYTMHQFPQEFLDIIGESSHVEPKNLRIVDCESSTSRVVIELLFGLCKLNDHRCTVPKTSQDLQNLDKLTIFGNKHKDLSDSICWLRALKELHVESCGLEKLPEAFGELDSLEILVLSENCLLDSLPRKFGNLKSLKDLWITSCGIKCLPQSFKDLQSLRNLDLSFDLLESFTLYIDGLRKLEKFNCLISQEEISKKGTSMYQIQLQWTKSSGIELRSLDLSPELYKTFTQCIDGLRKFEKLRRAVSQEQVNLMESTDRNTSYNCRTCGEKLVCNIGNVSTQSTKKSEERRSCGLCHFQRRCNLDKQLLLREKEWNWEQTALRTSKEHITDHHTCYTKEGLKNRVCILIYDSSEATFWGSCEAIARVLGSMEQQCSLDSIAVLSMEYFKSYHLQIIHAKEEEILQLLLEEMMKQKMDDDEQEGLKRTDKDAGRINEAEQTKFERKVVQEMTHLIYSSFRFQKAKIQFIQKEYCLLLFGENEGQKDEKKFIDHLENIAFQRWLCWVVHNTRCEHTDAQKGTLLKLLMNTENTEREDLLANLRNLGCTDSKVMKYSEDIFCWEKVRMEYICNDFDLQVKQLGRFVDQLFSMSVYNSGFPSYIPDLPDYSPDLEKNDNVEKNNDDYQFYYGQILSFFLVSNYTSSEKEFRVKYHPIMKNIFKFLQNGRKNFKQWLWIHYTGHNDHDSNSQACIPSAILRKAFMPIRDLFSDIVISLDCCHPEVLCGQSDNHITRILACKVDQTTEYRRTNTMTDFAEKLVSVLSSCDPQRCPIDKSGTCNECQSLQRAILNRGFVCTEDLQTYFKYHKTKGSASCEEAFKPLVYATRQ